MVRDGLQQGCTEEVSEFAFLVVVRFLYFISISASTVRSDGSLVGQYSQFGWPRYFKGKVI